MRTWIMEVVGLHSEGCIETITQALSSLPGVHDVTVSLLHSKITVQCDENLPFSRIAASLEAAGYRTEKGREGDLTLPA